MSASAIISLQSMSVLNTPGARTQWLNNPSRATTHESHGLAATCCEGKKREEIQTFGHFVRPRLISQTGIARENTSGDPSNGLNA
jgi:hypothetical protein